MISDRINYAKVRELYVDTIRNEVIPRQKGRTATKYFEKYIATLVAVSNVRMVLMMSLVRFLVW